MAAGRAIGRGARLNGAARRRGRERARAARVDDVGRTARSHRDAGDEQAPEDDGKLGLHVDVVVVVNVLKVEHVAVEHVDVEHENVEQLLVEQEKVEQLWLAQF